MKKCAYYYKGGVSIARKYCEQVVFFSKRNARMALGDQLVSFNEAICQKQGTDHKCQVHQDQ